MLRVFYIFWREYWGNLTRRSYLIFTFGFPVFMVVAPLAGGAILALALLTALPPTDSRPIGLVDQAGLLTEAEDAPSQPVEVRRFADFEAATEALEQGQIQAIYQIQADYWESGQIELTYQDPPNEFVDGMVRRWVRDEVRNRVPDPLLKRLTGRPQITHHGVSSQSNFTQRNLVEPIIVYLILYFVRLAGSFTASYMFDSIASEADDRTLEILITSVTPLQFVTGKLLGLLAVGLTQIGTWALTIMAMAVAGGALLGVDLLGFLWRWEHLGLMITVLLAAYLMDQILAAGMGLLRVSGGAGNLLFSTLNAVIGVSLIYAAYFVPRNPHTPVAIAASLFPVTAPLVLLIRVVVSEVPAWQIWLSQALLWGTNLAGLYWLRRLLQTNLLAGSRRTGPWGWLKKQWRRLRPTPALEQQP